MVETAGGFMLRKGRRVIQNEELHTLHQGLHQTRVQMNQAYSNFNSTGDSDLIESYVFELNALEARYAYLLRRVKELEQKREV